MKQKPQILVIHGGETFKNDKDYLRYLKTKKISLAKRTSWKNDYLDKTLGGKFEIIRPGMPLPENAKYRDWKIFFERHFPFLRNNIVLIGNSLGGIFLAKYLSEHKFPKKILSVYLICAPYDNSHTAPGDQLVGGFRLKSDLSLLDKSSKRLTLMFSGDDKVVPVYHAEMFRKKLKNAKIIVYKSKNGHFNIQKFPEIVKMIKEDLKTIKK